MTEAKVVVPRFESALLDLRKRLGKYREGLDALSRDGEITEAKIKKRMVKLDTALKEAASAQKAMKELLRGQFLKDYATADDDVKDAMDKWERQTEKMLAEMEKLIHIAHLLPPAEAFFE